jgi:hypothetical protein
MNATMNRRRISIGGNWRKDGPDHEWAGDGTVDQFGAVECSADLGDEAYERIEEQIEDGQTEGRVNVTTEDGRSITYHWSIED